MSVQNIIIMTKQQQMERVIHRLENMLLAESVEKSVIDNEAFSILQDMCNLMESSPEIVEYFNNEMQKIILDIVDLSLMRAEYIKSVKNIERLTTQSQEKATKIITRFDKLESKFKQYIKIS